jgi:hypothetical protein
MAFWKCWKIHGKSLKIPMEFPSNRHGIGHGAEATRPKMPGSYNDVVARLRSWFSGSGFQLHLEEKQIGKLMGKLMVFLG